MYIRHTGQLKRCAVLPPSPLHLSRAKSLVVCLYLLDSKVESDDCPQASKSNFSLTTETLTFDLLTAEVDRSCPSPTCALVLKSVHSFSKYSIDIKRTNKRTDRRTDRQHNVTGHSRLAYAFRQYSLTLLLSCVFMMLSAFGMP